MPQSHYIKRVIFIAFQCSRSINLNSKVIGSKFPRSIIFLNSSHPPSFRLHGMSKIACTCTNIQQYSPAKPRMMLNEVRLTDKHILSYPMVDLIHQSFMRIAVRNIVGRIIVTPYFSLARCILRKDKATRVAHVHIKIFACSIMICTRHQLLEMFFSAKRTYIDFEYIHFYP